MEMTHEERKELTPAYYNSLVKAENHYKLTLPPYEHDKCRGIWFYGPPSSGKSYWASR